MTEVVSGKRVLVFGLGVSGRWAAAWLASLGASVHVSDHRGRSELDNNWCSELEDLEITIETGNHTVGQVEKADLIVISPGIPTDLPVLDHARSLGIPVVGEMELASRFIHSPVIAVTGTNGKSTVTSLIGAVLMEAGLDVFVGGNLGMPLSALAASGARPDWAVLEVSSFQLDSVETFRPQVSVILNITPDHLDRYPDYQAYARSKMRIYARQTKGQCLVVNDDDPISARAVPPGGVKVFRYGFDEKPGRQAFVKDKVIVVNLQDGSPPATVSVAGAGLTGRHNVENIMACALVGRILGVEAEVMQRAVDRFRGLPHRMELVAEHMGVSFYDDSKATNVAAAAAAVSGMDCPVVLIAGGRHKGADYRALVDAAREKVKEAVFIGEAAGLLAEAFEGEIPFEIAAGMQDAVMKAVAVAAPGDAVLLAPACSSFDMFTDYGHRGRVFAGTVERMIRG